jgi:hypothetical protein
MPSPTVAVGSNDQNIKQIVELCNEAGQEISRRYPWQALTNEATFTTLAAESQGTMSSIAPNYDYIINDTIWNRTLRRPVFGPKTPQTWQQNKAFAINGPWSNFRVIGDTLKFYPTPSAGQSCYFEYITKNWVSTSLGSSNSSWTNDADTPLLDGNMLVLDTIWRWKAQKGLEYSEDFNKAERIITDLSSRDGSKDWLSLSNTKYDIFPGVVVPAGSWNV